MNPFVQQLARKKNTQTVKQKNLNQRNDVEEEEEKSYRLRETLKHRMLQLV